MSNITITIDADLLADCAEALRYKARTEAGMSQAPDLFAAEDTLEWAQADQVEALAVCSSHTVAASEVGFTEQHQVRLFNEKFGVPMSPVPAFLDYDTLVYRIKFMAEELQEFCEAHGLAFTFVASSPDVPQCHPDLHNAADALVDLAYVVHGTALMMGLPWPLLWHEVQRANMAKERAKHISESKRQSTLDVIKPAGWQAPNHTEAVGQSPWPVFNAITRTLALDEVSKLIAMDAAKAEVLCINTPRAPCRCGAKGFAPSKIAGLCTFCDGTEGGNPPVFRDGEWRLP